MVRESIKWESIRQRASRDTELFRQSPKSFWTVEVIGAAVFAVGGALYGFQLQPPNPTTFQQFIFPTVGASIGVLLGFLIVYGLVYIWNLFRAPYRMLSEAKIKCDELTEQINNREDRKKQILADLLQSGDELFNQHLETNEEFIVWECKVNNWYASAIHSVADNFSNVELIFFKMVSSSMLPFSYGKSFKGAGGKHNKYLNQLRAYLENLRQLLSKD